MIEGLQRLLDLQRVDEEFVASVEENAGVPARRARLEEARASCDARLEAAKQGLADAETAQRRAETELQDQEALLQKLEGQQNQVKTNEAYTALLHEMDAARQAISECETRILESMEAIEAARATLSRAEGAVAEERTRIDAEEKAIDERERELAATVERLRARRDELAATVPSDLIARYDRITTRRRPGVVTVREEVCSGCRVDIPAQSYIEVLRGEKLVSCGHCGRILVHADKLGPPPAA